MAETSRRTLWQRFLDALDDALPMSPSDRARRDDNGRDHSEYRKGRLGLHLREKRGKGGFR